MGAFTRRSRVGGWAVLLLLIGGLSTMQPQPAQACGQVVLVECFARGVAWPWENPVGSGRVWRVVPGSPAQNRWDLENVYYDIHICPTDNHSLWCIGAPAGNDPNYTEYPANLDTYTTYGRIDLTNAQSATVSWFMLNESEPGGDSIYWGAARHFTLTLANMNWGGSFSGEMLSEWQLITMDLANLRNMQTGDSVSLLGEDSVYVFWRFKADGDSARGFGAFIDNVVITYDDGGLDVAASHIELYKITMGDTVLLGQPVAGDTAVAVVSWTTCTGTVAAYPPFRVRTRHDDGLVLLDTLITGAPPGVTGTLWTQPWIVAGTDTHRVSLCVDCDSAVAEVDEANNELESAYAVRFVPPPPTVVWIAPGDAAPLVADSVAWLIWEAYDTLDQALITIYADLDSLGGNGVPIPDGTHAVLGGRDSLAWPIYDWPAGRVRWVYARIIDSDDDLIVYARQPVVRATTSTGDRPAGAVPARFFLAENYPNPFNPGTEITYGLAAGGAVSLKVYDLLGREVAVLVDAARAPGTYRASFNGTHLASGVYLCVLSTPEGAAARKMMLLK